MKDKKILVILNPISGATKINIKTVISTVLDNYQSDYQFVAINNFNNYLVDINHFDLVLIGGGDGTVNAVVSSLIKNNYHGSIGVIPLGSANLLANYLGIPILISRAVRAAMEQDPVDFDVMFVNQKYYSLVAVGLGYDAMVMRLTARGLKRVFGFGAYIIAMIESLFNIKEYNFSLLVDGRRINCHAKTIFVMNIGRFLGVSLGPNVYHQDGLINVGIVRPVSVFDAFRLFLGLVSKKYFIKNRLEYFSCKRLGIIFNKLVPVQIDGEIVELGERIDILVLPRAVKIIGKL